MSRRTAVIVSLAALFAVAGGAAYWFQPWRLATTTVVDEALPGLPAAVTMIAEGELISHEHPTTGLVRLVRDTDGSTVVRIERLDTSDGPDLHVLISDAPVLPGRDGWHVFDDGRHVDLGALRGNQGNANYRVPAGVDVTGLNSVSIWCDRFDVSFGAAALTPV